MKLLAVQNVYKSFGGIEVAKDLNFEIDEGSIVAIIGPNGAGKSTLFNLITGHAKVDSGKILFRGKDTTNLPTYRVAQNGISRCFQLVNLFENLSVLENVRLGVIGSRGHGKKFLGGMNKTRENDKEVLGILEDLGILHFANDLPGNLPYGTQKRLEIAIGLAYRSSLFLMDEPTAGMNEEESVEIMEIVQKIKQKHATTVCFVEHDLDVVASHAEKVYVLSGGRIVASGTPTDVLQDSIVKSVYLGG